MIDCFSRSSVDRDVVSYRKESLLSIHRVISQKRFLDKRPDDVQEKIVS